MPTFAAIDIGSNSVRLKIARLARHRLQVIHEDREVTRLGKSVFTSGLLAPEAMAQTIKVLQRFHKAAQKKGTDTVRVVATSALRDARNRLSFTEWVRAATGWKVEIISGLEEARLIHLGLRSNIRFGQSPVLMVDLGGGSCELTISANGHIRYTVSLPLGAVRLTEEFLKHDIPTAKELKRLRSFIEKELSRVVGRITALHPRVMLATSGTAAALAAVCLRTAKKQAAKPNQPVPRRAAVKMAEKLSRLSGSQRASLPGVGPRRAEIIVPGAMVFAELLERCGLNQFRYLPLGVRDGLLAQMASDYDAGTRSRRQIESDREDSLLNAARHYRVEQRFAQQVRELALALFRQMRAIHSLPPNYAELISAAAMLHEVGAYVNRYGWHRHTYYVIANTEILGYTTYERSLIAAIARYLGNSRPGGGDKPVRALTTADQVRLPQAVLLLRLARALNQSRRGLVKGVRVQAKGGKTRIAVRPKRGAGPDLELWALEKERPNFREVFGRELEAVAT